MEASEILRRLKVIEYKLKEHKKNGSCSCSGFVLQYEGSCQCKYGLRLSVLETDHMNLLRELPGGLIDKTTTWQDQPTEDGYYWFKVTGKDTEQPTIRFWSKKIEGFCEGVRIVSKCAGQHSILGLLTGKWYGPITPPDDN